MKAYTQTAFCKRLLLHFQFIHIFQDLHYQVYAADTHEIVRRVKSRQDDMGFAYVMQNQLAAFQYFLLRNYLEFEPQTETEVNIYTGKKN